MTIPVPDELRVTNADDVRVWAAIRAFRTHDDKGLWDAVNAMGPRGLTSIMVLVEAVSDVLDLAMPDTAAGYVDGKLMRASGQAN